MTDFAALLVADDGRPARTLHAVTKAGFAAWLDAADGATRDMLNAGGFTGEAGGMALVPGGSPGVPYDVVVGVDAFDDPWALAAAAAKLPAGTYRLADGGPGLAAHGWLMAQHHFDRYRSDVPAREPRILLTRDDVAPAIALAEASALVRDLVDTPAADLTPAALADAVVAQGELFGAHVAVIAGDDLLAGFPAVHAVGRAAAAGPRLIDLTWGDPQAPKLTLVGKGVTFDSGGLDIKPASGMLIMKKDMGGAAHALALARLVMQARLPVRLRLVVPAVENAIAGNAFHPGDVLPTRAGITVEIGNTDAEGRLILADALTYAQGDDPGLLLDFATLTGAARVALGPELPALFTHDEALAADLAAVATAAGDPLWRLPLWPGYRDMLKSTVADINNAGEGGFAGAITAALFLDRFVAAEVAWAHLDLYAWNPAAKPGRPKGGAATGLHAVWALLQRRFAARPGETPPE